MILILCKIEQGLKISENKPVASNIHVYVYIVL